MQPTDTKEPSMQSPIPPTEDAAYRRRLRVRKWMLLPLLALVAMATLWAIGTGPNPISWSTVWSVLWDHLMNRSTSLIDPVSNITVWDLRVPRVAMGLLVGAALAGSGAVYQGVFRNAMADPYIIGVSSGAALGA